MTRQAFMCLLPVLARNAIRRFTAPSTNQIDSGKQLGRVAMMAAASGAILLMIAMPLSSHTLDLTEKNPASAILAMIAMLVMLVTFVRMLCGPATRTITSNTESHPGDLVTCAEVTGRPTQGVAAFDFDGTITTSDSLRDYLRHTVGTARLISAAIRTSPWLFGALTGLCDRGDAKARLLAVTLRGMTHRELETAARRYATERLPKLIRPEMVERIREHRVRNDRLVLVSASLSLYLEFWAKSMGFDAVLATDIEFRDGRFSGRLASRNCRGPEKVRRLREWFGRTPPYPFYAYGDSPGDAQMLALADYAWLRGHTVLPAIETWARTSTAHSGERAL